MSVILVFYLVLYLAFVLVLVLVFFSFCDVFVRYKCSKVLLRMAILFWQVNIFAGACLYKDQSLWFLTKLRLCHYGFCCCCQIKSFFLCRWPYFVLSRLSFSLSGDVLYDAEFAGYLCRRRRRRCLCFCLVMFMSLSQGNIPFLIGRLCPMGCLFLIS
jgi:hypothetical protein